MTRETWAFAVAVLACLGAASFGAWAVLLDALPPPAQPAPGARSARRFGAALGTDRTVEFGPREAGATRERSAAWGAAFAARTRVASALPHAIRDPGLEPVVDAALGAMCDLPLPTLRLLHAHGGRIVFHAGRITDQTECEDLRGQSRGVGGADQSTYDDVPGLYRPLLRTLFVRADRDAGDVSHTFLHELGHMLDHALADISQTPEWGAALESDDAAHDLGYAESFDVPQRRRAEYFADAFAYLATSEDWRLFMRDGRPAATAFFADLDADIARADRRRIEADVDRALAGAKPRSNGAPQPRQE